MTRHEAALAMQAAEDMMLLYGVNEQTQEAMDAAIAAWAEAAMEDGLQAMLGRSLAEALEREGAHWPGSWVDFEEM